MYVLIAGFVYFIMYSIMSISIIKDYIKYKDILCLIMGILTFILVIISLICICAGINHIATCQDKDFKPSYCEVRE